MIPLPQTKLHAHLLRHLGISLRSPLQAPSLSVGIRQATSSLVLADRRLVRWSYKGGVVVQTQGVRAAANLVAGASAAHLAGVVGRIRGGSQH